mmetsp:Transcript_3096/g.7478  ORF Transcript_3096/g.7478 Transcript_3096/m.7478 type:complete len:241 (-) Transcript_3096:21-743(-)
MGSPGGGGVLALEAGGERGLGSEKAEAGHGRREVRRLHDGLALDEGEDKASVCPQKEDERHGAHKSLVQVSVRLAKVGPVGAGGELAGGLGLEAGLPPEVGTVAAHGAEHNAHVDRVEPVKNKGGKVEALEEGSEEVHVRSRRVDERGGPDRLCEKHGAIDTPHSVHGVHGSASELLKLHLGARKGSATRAADRGGRERRGAESEAAGGLGDKARGRGGHREACGGQEHDTGHHGVAFND